MPIKQLQTREYINLFGNLFLGTKRLIYDCLYPKFCIGCGKYGVLLCSDCFEKIHICKTSTCFFCGRLSKLGKVCQNCRKKNCFAIGQVIWAGSYQDRILKELIHEYKYNGILEAGEILAGIVNARLLAESEQFVNHIVVPVPIHPSKLKKRGFNQAEFFARKLSEHFGPHGGLALRRVKKTVTQVGLTKLQRQNNLEGSILCIDSELVCGHNVLLIDDVATTGTTLNECAKALKAAGAKKIDAFVIARD